MPKRLSNSQLVIEQIIQAHNIAHCHLVTEVFFTIFFNKQLLTFFSDPRWFFFLLKVFRLLFLMKK